MPTGLEALERALSQPKPVMPSMDGLSKLEQALSVKKEDRIENNIAMPELTMTDGIITGVSGPVMLGGQEVPTGLAIGDVPDPSEPMMSVEQRNYDGQPQLVALDDYDSRPPAPKPFNLKDEVGKGLYRGMGQMGTMGHAILAAISNMTQTPKSMEEIGYGRWGAAPQLSSESTPFANAQLKMAHNIRENIAKPENQAAVASLEQVNSPDDFLKWFVGMGSEQIPIMASMAMAGTVGGGVGVGLASAGMETGSIYQDIYEQTGKAGSQEAFMATLGGSVAGSLDVLPVMRILKRTGVAPKAEKEILERVAKTPIYRLVIEEGAKQAGAEGSQELTQTVLEHATVSWAADHLDLFDEDTKWDIINSTAAGIFLGGSTGTMATPGMKLAASQQQKMQQEAEVQQKDQQMARDALLTAIPEPTNEEVAGKIPFQGKIDQADQQLTNWAKRMERPRMAKDAGGELLVGTVQRAMDQLNQQQPDADGWRVIPVASLEDGTLLAQEIDKLARQQGRTNVEVQVNDDRGTNKTVLRVREVKDQTDSQQNKPAPPAKKNLTVDQPAKVEETKDVSDLELPAGTRTPGSTAEAVSRPADAGNVAPVGTEATGAALTPPQKPATISSMAEKPAARDNIAPEKTAKAGREVLLDNANKAKKPFPKQMQEWKAMAEKGEISVSDLGWLSINYAPEEPAGQTESSETANEKKNQIQELIDKYENLTEDEYGNVEIADVRTIAERIEDEGLTDDQEILDAIKDLRQAIDEDRFEGGMRTGLPEEKQEQFYELLRRKLSSFNPSAPEAGERTKQTVPTLPVEEPTPATAGKEGGNPIAELEQTGKVEIDGNQIEIKETDYGFTVVTKHKGGKFSNQKGGTHINPWSRDEAIERAKEELQHWETDKLSSNDLTTTEKSGIENNEVTNEPKQEKTGTGRSDRIREDGGEALETVSSETGEVPGAAGGTVRVAEGGGGPGRELHGGSTTAESGLPRSNGGGDTDVDSAARHRGGGRSTRRKSGLDNHLNYRITDADEIEKGGAKTKYKNNVAAIQLLKQIESEGRKATAEEQKVLVKYTGWGGLPQAFSYWPEAEWKTEVEDLKNLLTDEEYETARASTPNAHYTSPEVVKGIWKGLQKLGFKGGRICEPSGGTGMFFGLMPDEIADNSTLSMVELDSITGRIASQLYQGADVRIKGYEQAKFPDNYFDLHISNVPFGDYKVYDPDLRNVNFNIHDFFFAKALQKTRPGGLVVFITSKGTLDKQSDFVRNYFAKQADLVGAIRLPKTAFKGIANTEVVTDIIVFQKRDPQQAYQGEKFSSITTVKDGEDEFSVNEYYQSHPENVLGKHSYSGSMYRGNEYTVEPKEGTNFIDDISKLIAAMKLPASLELKGKAVSDLNQPAITVPAPDHVKEGAYVIEKGKIMQKNGEYLIPVKVSGVDRMKALIRLRDAARELIYEQLNPEATEKSLAAKRKNLNFLYDDFVKKNDPISKNSNQKLFREDPDLPLLLSLEHYDIDTQTAAKADIFTKRTQEPYQAKTSADNAIDALSISQNERGRLDLEFMAQLTGKDVEAVIEELGDLIYENPEGTWETADIYLSGNVRKKLAAAESAAALDPKFQRNVEALKAVQPADLPASQIKANLGASWVEPEDYKDFIRHIAGVSWGKITVRKLDMDGTWVIDTPNYSNMETTVTWGTSRVDAITLIKQAMNTQQPTVTQKVDDQIVVNQEETIAARAKQDAIKEEFSKWIWQDMDRRERLARKYNDQFNNTVKTIWNGKHLTLPGKNPFITMRDHQLNGIWRILINGNTLLGHEVGAGKTFLMTAAAMEMRRLGKAKKPVIVVPNHLLSQWQAEFLQLYPSAQILVASKKDFEPKRRQTLMNRIATGDWDAVIVPMTSFEKIPISKEKMQSFFNDQIAELEHAILETGQAEGRKSKTVKELEKSKKRLEAQLEKMSATYKKDAGPYFDELGIDALFVDEAHNYKNLFFSTKMTRVPGIPQNITQRSFDMFAKCLHLNQITGGKGLVFATGTPISNSVTEMFTMQRYLQLGLLEEAGVSAFDFWANNFGEKVTAVETTPDGGRLRMFTRFARFINIPELSQMFNRIADIIRTKDLNLPLPKPKIHQVIAPRSEEIRQIVKDLVKRAERIQGGHVDPRQDNMLKITTEGRKAALDIRLIDSGFPDHADSKVNTCVQNVYDIWEKTGETKSLQVIWCDLSAPQEGFNIYDDVKKKLIGKGIPREEIAFIHDAQNTQQQQSLYKKAREGKIRVLMASTAKMGTGANIQNLLAAAHHLDPPWKPADLEQRDGRIVRQGNTHKNVDIYQYSTKGSFDTYMWQLLELKAKFIHQILTNETTAREMDDVGDQALRYAEMKALSANNPKLMEYVALESQVRSLQAQEKSHLNQQWELQRKSRDIPASIANYQKLLDDVIEDNEHYQKAKESTGDTQDITLNGKNYTDKKEAAQALEKIVQKYRNSKQSVIGPDAVGETHGFKILISSQPAVKGEPSYHLVLTRKHKYQTTDLTDNPDGNLSRIFNTLNGIESTIQTYRDIIAGQQKRLEEVKKGLNTPFAKQQELVDGVKRLAELKHELSLDKKETEEVSVENKEDQQANDKENDLSAEIDQEIEEQEEIKRQNRRESGKVIIPTVEDISELFSMPSQAAHWLASSPLTIQSVDALAKAAPKWGKVLGDTFFKIDDREAELAGHWLFDLKEAMGRLTRKEQENFRKAIRGHEDPMNQTVAQAVTAVLALTDRMGTLKEDVGLKAYGAEGETQFQKREDMYPLHWSKDTQKAVQQQSGPIYEKLVNWIAADMKARNIEYVDETLRDRTKKWSDKSYREQAERFLRDKRKYEPAGAELTALYHTLQSGEEPLPKMQVNRKGWQYHRAFEYPDEFLDTNPYRVMESFVYSSARRIAEAEVWGPKSEKLKKLIAAGTTEAKKQTQAKQKDADRAQVDFLKTAAHLIGYESNVEGLQSDASHGAKAWMRGARVATASMHLANVSAPARNILFGTAAMGTHFGTVRSTYHFLGTLFAPGRIAAARKAGALEHSGVDHFFAEGLMPEVVKALRMPMGIAEVLLRSSAAHCGYATWSRAVKQAHKKGKAPTWLVRELTNRDVGFTEDQVHQMVKRGIVDEAEKGKMMRGAVKVTQFTADAKDIPKSWGTETGRFVTQFYAMAYKHTQNTIGYALQEMGYLRFTPIMRFAITAMFAGIGQYLLRQLFRGEEPDPEDLEKIDFWLKTATDSLGIIEKPLDVLTAKTEGDVLRAMAPASLGTAASLFYDAQRVVKSLNDSDVKQTNAWKSLGKNSGLIRDILGLTGNYALAKESGKVRVSLSYNETPSRRRRRKRQKTFAQLLAS